MLRARLKFSGSSSHPKLPVICRNLCLALLSSFWETKRKQLMMMKTSNNLVRVCRMCVHKFSDFSLKQGKPHQRIGYREKKDRKEERDEIER